MSRSKKIPALSIRPPASYSQKSQKQLQKTSTSLLMLLDALSGFRWYPCRICEHLAKARQLHVLIKENEAKMAAGIEFEYSHALNSWPKCSLASSTEQAKLSKDLYDQTRSKLPPKAASNQASVEQQPKQKMLLQMKACSVFRQLDAFSLTSISSATHKRHVRLSWPKTTQ